MSRSAAHAQAPVMAVAHGASHPGRPAAERFEKIAPGQSQVDAREASHVLRLVLAQGVERAAASLNPEPVSKKKQ